MSGFRSLGTSPSRHRSEDSHRLLFKSFNNPNFLPSNQRNLRSMTNPYNPAFEKGIYHHKFLSQERQATDQTNFQSTNKLRDQLQFKQFPIFENSDKRNFLTTETNGSNFITRCGIFNSVASAGLGDLMNVVTSEADKSYSNSLYKNELAKKKIEYFISSAKNLILSSLKLKKLIQNNSQVDYQYEINLFDIDSENMGKALKHLGISSKDSDIGFQKLLDELKEENNNLKMRMISEPFKSARENVELSQRYEQEMENLKIKYEKMEKQFQKNEKKYQEKKATAERLYSILEEKEKELQLFQQDFEIINIQLQNKMQDIYFKDEQLSLLEREIANIQNHNQEYRNYPNQSQHNVQELAIRLQDTELYYETITRKLESELIRYQEENQQIRRQWMEIQEQIDLQHLNVQNQQERVLSENQDIWEKRLEQCANEWQKEVQQRDHIIQQNQRDLESQIKSALLNERKIFEQQQKIQVLEQQKELREEEFDNVLERQKRKIQTLNEEIGKKNSIIKSVQIQSQVDGDEINNKVCQTQDQNIPDQQGKEKSTVQNQRLQDQEEQITLLKQEKVLQNERISSQETKICEIQKELQKAQDELKKSQYVRSDVEQKKGNGENENNQYIEALKKQLLDTQNALKAQESLYLSVCAEIIEARERIKTIKQELINADLKIQQQTDENNYFITTISQLQNQSENLKSQLEEQQLIRSKQEDQQKQRVQEILQDIKLSNNYFANLQEELQGAKFSWENAQKAIQILGEKLQEKDRAQNIQNQKQNGEIDQYQIKVQELMKIQQKIETDISQVSLINDNMRKEIIIGEKQIQSIEQMNKDLEKQVEDQQIKQLQICDQQQILAQNHVKCMELKLLLSNNDQIQQKQEIQIESKNERQSQLLDSLQAEYNLLNQKYQDSKEKLKSLEYEYEQNKIQLDSKIQQSSNLCKQLKEEIILLTKENENIKLNIIQKDENLTILKQNLQDNEKERVNTVNLYEKQVDELNKQIKQTQEELIIANQKIDLLNENYQSQLQGQHNQIQSQQQNLQSQQQNLQDKLLLLYNENKEHIESKNKIQNQLETILKQNQQFSSDINSLQSELNQKQQDVCIGDEQIRHLNEKCESLEKKCIVSEQKYITSEENQKILKDEVNKLQLKINILQNDKERILLELQTSQESGNAIGIERNLALEEIQTELKNMKTRSEFESTQSQNQLSLLQQQLEQVNKEYQENKNKLQNYEQENLQITERNNQLFEKLKDYEQIINDQQSKQNQFQKTYDQLAAEKDQISQQLEYQQKNHDLLLISHQQQINEKDNILQNTIKLQEQKELLIQDLILKINLREQEIQYLKANQEEKIQENNELNKKIQSLIEQAHYLQEQNELQAQENFKNILPNQISINSSIQTSKPSSQKLISKESPMKKLDQDNSQSATGQQDDTEQLYQLNSPLPKSDDLKKSQQKSSTLNPTSIQQSNDIQSSIDNNDQLNEEYIIEEFDCQNHPQNILKQEKSKKSSLPLKNDILIDEMDTFKQINQYQTQINELNQQVNELNQEINAFNIQIDNLSKQNNEINNQNIDLNIKTTDLNKQNEDLKIQMDNLKEKQIVLENENIDLNNQVKILNKEFDDLNSEIKNLNQQIEDLKQQNSLIQEQNEQLNKKIIEISTNEQNLKYQLGQQEKSEVDSEKSSKIQIEQLQKALNEEQNKVSPLQAEISHLQEQLQKALNEEQNKVSPLQAEISHLQEQLNLASDELKEQNQRILSLQKEITLGENQMDQQQQTILFLQDKIESQSEYLKHVEEELKQQQTFSAQLENNLEKKRKQLEDSDNLQLETEQRLKSELSLKQEYIQKLESSYKNKAELTLAQSQQTTSELQNEVNRLKIKLDKSKQDQNTIDGLKREIRELQYQIRDSNIERERLEMDRQQFEDDMNLQRLSQQDLQFKLEVLEMKTKNYFGMLLKILLIFDVDLDEQVSTQTHSLEDLLSLGLQLSKQHKSNTKNLQLLQKSPIEGTTAASLFTLQSPHITSQSENPNLIKSYSQCLEGLINNILSNPTNLRNSLQIDLLQHPYQQMFFALLNQVEVQFQQVNTLLTNQQPSSIRDIEENFDDFQKQLQIQQQKQQIKSQMKANSPSSMFNNNQQIKSNQLQARNSQIQQDIYNRVPSFVRDDDSFLEDLNSNNENKVNINNFEPFNPLVTTSPSNKNHPTFENQTNQMQIMQQEFNALKIKFNEEKEIIINRYEQELNQLKKQIKELREMTKDVELIKNQKQTLKAITENFLGLLSDKKKQKTQEAEHFFNILCSMLDIQANIKEDLKKGLFSNKK